MSKNLIIVGDKPEELRALQLLAFALAEAAACVSPKLPDETKRLELTVAPLLLAGAGALGLASCAGPDTPIEVLALSARNAFELWLRLVYIMASEANCQSWRDEALTDQLQVYEAILTQDGPEKTKAVVRDEIERVKRHGVARRLNQGQRPAMAVDLAKATGHKAEYDAFYKLYSKLVHPSSWFVNWPGAVSSEMYRATLSVNAQTYGWCMLEIIDGKFGVSSDRCYQVAKERFQALSGAKPAVVQ